MLYYHTHKILPPCVCSAESVPTECDVVRRWLFVFARTVSGNIYFARCIHQQMYVVGRASGKTILMLSPNVMYSPGFKLSFSIRTSMFIPLHPEDATLLIRIVAFLRYNFIMFIICKTMCPIFLSLRAKIATSFEVTTF